MQSLLSDLRRDGPNATIDPFIYLKETITEEGICYTFNMPSQETIFRKGALHKKFNYIEDWFEFNWSGNHTPTIPIHSSGAGISTGLMLYLRQSLSDTDYMCTGFSQGYKLMLHDSKEYPQVSKRNIRIPLGHEINIALKPQMIETSKSAAAYDWKKRQCFFDYERHLRFFQHYTQDNCELECLTNMTLAICNCLPACKSTHYDLEITQSSLDIEKFMKANSVPVDNNDEKYAFTTLEIYFKESHFITSKRTELYGFVDLLANCGGLLGLFMGVSFLSLIEICYFLTIRPFSIRRKRQPRKLLSNGNDVNSSLLAVVSKKD
ncbi:hypothetical protein AND_003023 [Anopheles darlingi]|uniref:Pickpocket n=1 Tax=Anopheles darlingi TaxID=43151 RepID=W5JM38_ANODA|nr:hypothetical protein AND_003023 [Anopheles darlingi]